MLERVLLVDDERHIAQALTIRLRSVGYDVRCAFDGASALETASEWRPDVIVLDIRMPGIDGFEVKRRLEGLPDLRATPVIFLSANVQESARQAARDAGAHAFLTKPCEATDLLAAIRSAVDRKG